MAGSSALQRNLRWIRGILGAVQKPNFLTYSASLRGLLESAGDTCYSLAGIPLGLAENHAELSLALKGKCSDRMIVSAEMESLLIHYSHGSKILNQHQTGEKAWQPKTNREYIRCLSNEQNSPFEDLYALLCESTHPAFLSVMFLFDESEIGYTYKADPDNAAILDFIANFGSLLDELVLKSINPSLLVLKTLNHFDFENVRTTALDGISLDGIPAWKKIMDRLKA